MFHAILFLANYIFMMLQSTLLNISVFGIWFKPDLVLVGVVSLALLKGSSYGATWGFALGLLEDFLNGRFIGSGALSKMVTGFSAGYLEKNIFKDNPLVPFLCTFGFTIVNGLIMVFLLNAFRYPMSLFPALFYKILPTALYNAVLSPLVYFAVYRLDYYFRERYLAGS